ncbi:hypothetical protein Clos_1307 [Alkaliphilus oremlandii OhILAs]|uniref:Uncharacterized protein n=2 Tax=Alkaliphilus oremlandii TaxID=461876 RepID=A8MGC4_ALKOO|nr:hypothetical protein Clos_1307 [Alkaliphilus oremlandii OhILAs]
MPCTMIIAKVKKIDITNKVAAENWTQTITITLSDIELNDENLIAIRKFRPNEEVKVHLESLQLSIEEISERENLRKLYPTSGQICPANHSLENTNIKDEDIEEVNIDDEEGGDLFDLDYDENLPDTDKILKTFDFSKM